MASASQNAHDTDVAVDAAGSRATEHDTRGTAHAIPSSIMKTSTTTQPVAITFAPVVFFAPEKSLAATAIARRAAVAEVSRAVNAAYYAGIVS